MKEMLFRVPSEQEILYTDAELASFEDIAGASTLDELGREVRKVSYQLGFEHYLYGAHVPLANGERLQYIFSGYPEEWSRTYQEANYIRIDPVVRHCLLSQSNLPLVWSDEVFSAPVEKAFWEDAQGHGVASGVTIPIRGIMGEVALLSVANPERAYKTRSHDLQMIGSAYLLGAYVQEAIRRLVFNKELVHAPPEQLSPRELECLKWWVSGKTVDEIGLILGRSERTIRFHLTNVKHKLGAAGKAQAIAKAVQLKLV
jgi:LuxR family quorum-sensing transcriptional regulator LasR